MKRILAALLFFVLGSAAGVAQDSTSVLTNKRGVPILPTKGEWALGLSATPFFQYFGNMFNNSTNNFGPQVISSNNPGLIGKYMKNARTAYRVSITLNNVSSEGNNLVQDALSPGNSGIMVTDKKTYNSLNVLLGLGLEKRRGSGRLQGIYGFQGFLGVSSTHSEYTYGNQFTASNPVVPFTVWNEGSANPAYSNTGSRRQVESKSGTRLTIGVSGFVGVEYFIAPKIALGGELGYAITYSQSSVGSTMNEYWDFGSTSAKKSTSDYLSSPDSFTIGTVPVGNINLIMYF